MGLSHCHNVLLLFCSPLKVCKADSIRSPQVLGPYIIDYTTASPVSGLAEVNDQPQSQYQSALCTSTQCAWCLLQGDHKMILLNYVSSSDWPLGGLEGFLRQGFSVLPRLVRTCGLKNLLTPVFSGPKGMSQCLARFSF